MCSLLPVQFSPSWFINVHTTEEIQYINCFNYSKQASSPTMVIFCFLLQEKRSLQRFGKVIIYLFCSISECSSLFSKIYCSSPAFCLLDSAVIIFINVLKYVLRENTFRTAKLFHSFQKLYLFFDPFAWLAESLCGQLRGWDAYKIKF